MSYKRLKLKLRVFLAGNIVAMVTYCATKLTATCSPMIGQFVDTMTVALTIKSGYNDPPTNCKSWKVLETVSDHLNFRITINLITNALAITHTKTKEDKIR